mmetsp:Transcript_128593/g.222143  ORF Transcript_128593/g.222143 Transcript_128593/m.222143 type:complete len:280 (-) Transcript_128593:2073-2912(-)
MNQQIDPDLAHHPHPSCNALLTSLDNLQLGTVCCPQVPGTATIDCVSFCVQPLTTFCFVFNHWLHFGGGSYLTPHPWARPLLLGSHRQLRCTGLRGHNVDTDASAKLEASGVRGVGQDRHVPVECRGALQVVWRIEEDVVEVGVVEGDVEPPHHLLQDISKVLQLLVQQVSHGAAVVLGQDLHFERNLRGVWGECDEEGGLQDNPCHAATLICQDLAPHAAAVHVEVPLRLVNHRADAVWNHPQRHDLGVGVRQGCPGSHPMVLENDGHQVRGVVRELL